MADKKEKPKRIPVTILTGFLGSGKTTLMNNILNDKEHGLRFAIIENEFGEVGVDEKILSENCDEELVEVMNGCICCTVRGDLVVALKNLYKKIKDFDAVIIETTGLADPAPVAQTFFVDDDIEAKYELDGIITVVDAKHIIPRLDDEKPEGVENEAVEQVAFADRILLNKTDLVNNDESVLSSIEKRIRSINAEVQIMRCQQAKIAAKELIGIKGFDLKRVLEMDPEFMKEDAEHEHDPTVSSVSCKLVGYVNQAQLEAWVGEIMQEMGQNIFRYKGVLSVAGSKKKFIFQGVGMIFFGGYSDVEWGEEEVRENRFVFIGKNLDKDLLRNGFMACECVEELRFKVGDSVFALAEGEWTAGDVVALWDKGNPYKIKLEDDTEHFAKMDDDNYVMSEDSYADMIEAEQEDDDDEDEDEDEQEDVEEDVEDRPTKKTKITPVD